MHTAFHGVPLRNSQRQAVQVDVDVIVRFDNVLHVVSGDGSAKE